MVVFVLLLSCFFYIHSADGNVRRASASVGIVVRHGDGLLFAGHEVEVVVGVDGGEYLLTIVAKEIEPYHESRGEGGVAQGDGDGMAVAVRVGLLRGLEGHLGQTHELLPSVG